MLHNGGGKALFHGDENSNLRTMPIVVSCPCGKQLNLADDLAGAKIKCPACQAVLGVPAPVQDNPFSLAQPILPKDQLRSQEEMWDETDEHLRRRRDKHETPRSTTRLYVYLAGLFLILLFGLGCGIGGWYYFYAFTGNELVGSWEAEGGGAGRVRFGRAGDAAVTPMGGVTQHGAWRVLSKQGNVYVLEISNADGKGSAQATVIMLDDNRMRFIMAQFGIALDLKRMN